MPHHLAFRSIAAIISILLVVCLFAKPSPSQSLVHPPAKEFQNIAILRAVELEIEQGHYQQAGERIATLLQSHAAERMISPDGNFYTIARWAQAALDQHPAVLTAYRQATQPLVQQALRRLTVQPDHRPEQIYAIAAKFPRSASEDAILLAAAERAMQFGDPVSATAYLQKRSQDAPLPHHLAAIDATVAAIAAADKAVGLLPFNAPWFVANDRTNSVRSLPVSAGEMTFIAGPAHLIAVDVEGRIIWTASGEHDGDDINIVSLNLRGIVYEPAIATDPVGQPQVVVTRHVTDRSPRLVLRAYAAADGQVLWSSETDDSLAEVNFLGNPVISGGLVYAAGLIHHPQGAHLSMIALETATGRRVWDASLGRMAPLRIAPDKDGGMDPHPIGQQSPAAIAGDALIVAPGNGVVMSIDRFSGYLNWGTRYDRVADPMPADGARIRAGGARMNIPQHRLARSRGVVHVGAGIVVVVPADSSNSMAFDQLTGKLIWSRVSDGVLIGGNDERIILAGKRIIARDPFTGDEQWVYEPPADQPVTGLPVVRDDVVIVPLGSRVVTLSVMDGTQAAPPPRLPSMHRILALESVKRALRSAGLAEAFGVTDE